MTGRVLPVLSFALAMAVLPAHGEAETSPVGTRRALLIGINEYQLFPNLRGAVNDIDLIESVLTTRYGFSEEHIQRVTDAEATRKGILEALDALAGRAEPDDVVYVHYSGHGSQQSDASGDEPDGLDETLVPHDGRTTDVPDILDDELDEHLSRIKARRVVVVLDSCHSGTATRSIHVQTRSVPPDARHHLYERAGAQSRAVVPVTGDRYLLLSATPPDQSALDGPIDGRPYGLFSFSLGRALAEASPELPAEEILGRTEVELGRVKGQLGLTDVPEPQLEGPRERIALPLFPLDEAGARLPWVRAERRPGAGAVVLRGAGKLGAAPGSIWALYPPTEERFKPGSSLGEAEVTEVRGVDALARLTSDGLDLSGGARAVLLTPPGPVSEIPIAWLGDGTSREAVAAALETALPGARLVEGGAFARYVIDPLGSSWILFGADGTTRVQSIPAASVEEAAQEIAAVVSRGVTAAELLAIDNPTSAFRLDLSIARQGQRGLTIVPADVSAPMYQIRQQGEPRTPSNSLQLRAEADRDCYLTIVHVDTEGKIQTLFPNSISEARGYYPEGLLIAGQELLVPDSIADGNQAGFYLDYSPPAGLDTIRAFCHEGWDAASAFRSDLAVPQMRGNLSGVRRRFARVASRGIEIVAADSQADPGDGATAVLEASEGGDWSAASVTIEVQHANSDTGFTSGMEGP